MQNKCKDPLIFAPQCRFIRANGWFRIEGKVFQSEAEWNHKRQRNLPSSQPDFFAHQYLHWLDGSRSILRPKFLILRVLG